MNTFFNFEAAFYLWCHICNCKILPNYLLKLTVQLFLKMCDYYFILWHILSHRFFWQFCFSLVQILKTSDPQRANNSSIRCLRAASSLLFMHCSSAPCAVAAPMMTLAGLWVHPLSAMSLCVYITHCEETQACLSARDLTCRYKRRESRWEEQAGCSWLGICAIGTYATAIHQACSHAVR